MSKDMEQFREWLGELRREVVIDTSGEFTIHDAQVERYALPVVDRIIARVERILGGKS